MRKVCSVYVDKAVYSIDEPYEYIVPPEMEVVKGSRVLVPFSNSNRKTMGIVSKIGFDDNFEKKLKPIYKVPDEKPLLNQEMLDLIEFMVRNTFCTHFDAVRAILPVGTLYDISDTYSIDKQKAEEFTLTAEENNLLQFLSLSKTAKEMAQFLDCRGNVDKAPIVKSLMQKGIVKKDSKVSPKVSPKKVKMIRYQKENDILFDTLSKKQKEVAKTLKEVEVATVKELCTICGVTVGVVNALYKKGIADFFYEEISYNSSPCINFPKNDVVLSDEQAEAFIGIKQLVDNNSANVALLNGVTGSGKTKVYIKLIEYVLSLEKTAIMLVPEISLTPQTAKNFIDVFGDIVCVIHSGLSVSERLNQFNKIKCGECKIVIGTRSAVFSPLENIGIIILDEEGENSY
ncbi:MAG: DEAD/DEAH box helicase family protein, partial [Oscillospiraceae bacterium]